MARGSTINQPLTICSSIRVLRKNLPVRAKQQQMHKQDIFRLFISAIFYIGKGSWARPYQHLLDSLRFWKSSDGKPVDLDQIKVNYFKKNYLFVRVGFHLYIFSIKKQSNTK